MSSTMKYVFTLDESARKYAAEFLNETDESRENALLAMKEWIKEHPELHVKPGEKNILTFLRGCKFDLERTKQKMTRFYEMRRDRPEWFCNRNPLLLEIQELVKLGVFVPLNEVNVDNQMVVIIRAAAHDPKRHKFNDVLKAGKMILDIACEENERAQIFGVTAIFDMNGLSLGHARQMSPSVIGNAVYAWQNYHCRPKRLEYVNAPLYVNVVLNIFKSFMSAKLQGRVRVHFSGVDGVHDAVPKDILPKEYGGTNGEMKDLTDYWFKKLNEYSDWFAEDEQYKADPCKCDMTS